MQYAMPWLGVNYGIFFLQVGKQNRWFDVVGYVKCWYGLVRLGYLLMFQVFTAFYSKEQKYWLCGNTFPSF
jgi:hypothetical protein